jgi:hypothetical protein
MNNWDINILVNGNRCKQYKHNNRIYIEAKQGSEYAIEIKNNFWKRVLAVCSVDGLNVLTGEKANPDDSGYIVPGSSAEKIKGFRYSDTEWALFKFGMKYNGKTYAQSKYDGSEANCGVISGKIFYEKEPQYVPPTITITPTPIIINPPWHPWNEPYITYTTCTNAVSGGMNWANNSTTYTNNSPLRSRSGHDHSSNKISSMNLMSNCDDSVASAGLSYDSGMERDMMCGIGQTIKQSRGFDMGTEWGKREQSKITTVEFERGILAESFNIYYASRESLIQMGVPLTNELKVNLPQGFPGGYAKPPYGWQG